MSNTIIPIELGGTGASTAADAINNLLPPQEGKAGKVLSSDGDSVFWTDVATTMISVEQSTGSSLQATMSQKAITDALNAKADASDPRLVNGQIAYEWGNHALAGYAKADARYLVGDGLQADSENRIAVKFGTTAGTVAEGNDPRIVNAVPNHRTICAGKGLLGGGDLTEDRVLAVDFGTGACTVAEGNDPRILNGQQAFDWGDHRDQGYVTLADLGALGGCGYAPGDGLSIGGGGGGNGGGGAGAAGGGPTISVNFGTGPGEVAAGNDPRLEQGAEAWGWGDHNSMGYAKVEDVEDIVRGSYKPGAGINIAGDGTISVNFGTTEGTVVEGNDYRLQNAVPNTTTINGYPLTGDIVLTPGDVGACEAEHTHTAAEIDGLGTMAYSDLFISRYEPDPDMGGERSIWLMVVDVDPEDDDYLNGSTDPEPPVDPDPDPDPDPQPDPDPDPDPDPQPDPDPDPSGP